MKKNINWMVLGQTGSRKTSLLNYLFNLNLPTGMGKPVTPYGIFYDHTFISPIKPDVTYTIFDSWGLEANKSEQWMNIIFEKLDAGFSVKCDDLFLGIIYCISFASSRIQKFETDLIKDLITKCKYNVIIALTCADASDYKDKKKKYEDQLTRDLGSDNKGKYCTIDICSRYMKKKEIKPFGKEEMLQKIEEYGDSNLISIVKSKLGKWKDFWINKCNEYAIEQRPEIGYIKSDLLKTDVKVRRNLSKMYKQAIKEIKGEIEYTAKWKDYIKGSAYKGENLKSFDWYDILNPIKWVKYPLFDMDDNQENYLKVFENRIEGFNNTIKEVYDNVISNIKKQEAEIKLLGYKSE